MHFKSAIILCTLYFITIKQSGATEIPTAFKRFSGALFNKYDSNKDGKIGPEEFKIIHQELFGCKHVGKPALQDNDTNKNGTLDLDEFTKMIHDYIKNHEPCLNIFPKYFLVLASAHFDSFDDNKDGHISIDELTNSLKNLSYNDQTVDELYTNYDINKSGTLDRIEYIIMIFEVSNWSNSGADGNPELLKMLSSAFFGKHVTNDDNQMNLKEIEKIYQMLFNSNQERSKIVQLYDKNKSGTLDRTEFTEMILNECKKPENIKYGIPRYFLVLASALHGEFDNDGNGKIDAEEFARIQQELFSCEHKKTIEHYDHDGNGNLDGIEFAFMAYDRECFGRCGISQNTN